MLIVCVHARDWWSEIRILSADLPGWGLPIQSQGKMFGVHPEAVTEFVRLCGEIDGATVEGPYHTP